MVEAMDCAKCADRWQATINAVREENDRLRAVAERVGYFCEAVDSAAAHHRRGKGGQQVSFHGDWAHVVPSTIVALERWARDFRFALEPTKEIGESATAGYEKPGPGAVTCGDLVGLRRDEGDRHG